MISETSCSLRAADEVSPPPRCPTRLQKEKKKTRSFKSTHTLLAVSYLHHMMKQIHVNATRAAVIRQQIKLIESVTLTVSVVPVGKTNHPTSAFAPAALFACGSLGTVSRSTPAPCFPWLCAVGCFQCAPPSSPKPPLAGHSAGKTSVPEGSQKQNELSLMWIYLNMILTPYWIWTMRRITFEKMHFLKIWQETLKHTATLKEQNDFSYYVSWVYPTMHPCVFRGGKVTCWYSTRSLASSQISGRRRPTVFPASSQAGCKAGH